MHCYNDSIVVNKALNASWHSPAMQLQHLVVIGIQGVITGTPNGTINLQVSDDPIGPQAPVNFTDVPDSLFMVTASGTVTWNYRELGATWVRISYADASSGASAATITARINAKGW